MPKRSTANSATIPPPVNGWNTRDPISGMDPLYAIDTSNFIAKGGGVELRKGCQRHTKYSGGGTATDIIPILASVQNPDGTAVLVCTDAGGLTFYDATTAGNMIVFDAGSPYSGTSAVTPFTFNGNLIFAGQDGTPEYFLMRLDTTSPPGGIITAITPSPVITFPIVCAGSYKNILYLTDSEFPNLVKYGGFQNQNWGTTRTFDFNFILKKGGKTIFIGTLARSEQISDQYFMLCTDEGEILIYSGLDPSSPTWTIIGHYFIPPPTGTHAFVPYGSDMLILTMRGVVSMSDIMQNGQEINFMSDNINDQFSEVMLITAATSYYAMGCWWPEMGWIIFNIPIDDTTGAPNCIQFVYETSTRSWWKFEGLKAFYWCVHEGELYFASTHNKIFKITGYYDEDPANEGAILTRTIKLRPAYNYFGDRSASKQFVEARPILKQSEGLTLTMDADVDYQDTTATNTVTDLTNTAYKLYAPRVGLQGIGRCASIRIDGTVTTKRFRLEATEVIWNDGDI